MASCHRCRYNPYCSCDLRLRCLRSPAFPNTVDGIENLQQELVNTNKAVEITTRIYAYYVSHLWRVLKKLFGDIHVEYRVPTKEEYYECASRLSGADMNNLHEHLNWYRAAKRHRETYLQHNAVIMATAHLRQMQAPSLINVEQSRNNIVSHGEIDGLCHVLSLLDVKRSAIKCAREYVEEQLESSRRRQEFLDPQEPSNGDDDDDEKDAEYKFFVRGEGDGTIDPGFWIEVEIDDELDQSLRKTALECDQSIDAYRIVYQP